MNTYSFYIAVKTLTISNSIKFKIFEEIFVLLRGVIQESIDITSKNNPHVLPGILSLGRENFFSHRNIRFAAFPF